MAKSFFSLTSGHEHLAEIRRQFGSLGLAELPGKGAAVTLSGLTTVSRRLCHSRATEPKIGLVSPGDGDLTTSFATRGPRVQIPSAPLKTPWSRTMSVYPERFLLPHVQHSGRHRCSTGLPRHEAPRSKRGASPHGREVTGSNPVSSTSWSGPIAMGAERSPVAAITPSVAPQTAHVIGAKAWLDQDDICHIEFVIDLTTRRTGRSA